MKKLIYLIPCTLILSLAGCSKTESNRTGQSTHNQTATPSAPAKPKPAELTKDSLLEAFKRASINSLPVYLKISDAQFEVVNSVDSLRVIKGTVTLEFLEDTFKRSRVLEYRTPSSNYQIPLLTVVKKKGEQVSLPFSDRIDLANDRPMIQLPQLDNYGGEAAQFAHSYVEGSEKAVKAEGLIADAQNAAKKADLVQNKWRNLQKIKDGISDADSFRGFNGSGIIIMAVQTAFDDLQFGETLQTKFNKFDYNSVAQYQFFKDSVTPLLDTEYPRVEKINADAKEKAAACSDYLLNL